MHSNHIKSLNNFLAFTHAEQLGEGDANAGANLLACAACTIANLARPGSGIVSTTGIKVKVGSSLLVSGSFSTNLIREHVCSELTTMQNNWIGQLKGLLHTIKEEESKPGIKSFKVPKEPRSTGSENALMALQQPEPLLWGSKEEAWVEVIASPPTPKLLDMTATPKVIVTATDGISLNKQLIGLHSKRPLVFMNLNERSGSTKLAETCTALMNGTLPDSIGVETIDGNMLLLDSDNRLTELAGMSQKHDIRWMGNMLWLVDNDEGPEAKPKLRKDIQPIDQMEARINKALYYAMAGRLRNDQTHPIVHKVEFSDAQMRWIQYLKGMETSLPGITGSARQLLASLVFGVYEITHVRGFKNVDIDISYIENFARHLILRMAYARNAIYINADAEHRARLIRATLVKLQDGRQQSRDLYRALSIKAELCHDITHELATKKYIQKSENEWTLTPKAMALLGGTTMMTQLKI